MTWKYPVQNFIKIDWKLTEKSTRACAPDNCVIDFKQFNDVSRPKAKHFKDYQIELDLHI